MNKESEVQGEALFLEFRKYGSTCQVIITPDGYDQTGNFVGSTMFRRILYTHAPKRRWVAYTLPRTIEFVDGATAGTLSDNSLDVHIQNRIRNLTDYFESLGRQGYKLVNDTSIYIEVSREDLGMAQSHDLSTKLWNRIKSCRIASGFPEEVISTNIASAIL